MNISTGLAGKPQRITLAQQKISSPSVESSAPVDSYQPSWKDQYDMAGGKGSSYGGKIGLGLTIGVAGAGLSMASLFGGNVSLIEFMALTAGLGLAGAFVIPFAADLGREVAQKRLLAQNPPPTAAG